MWEESAQKVFNKYRRDAGKVPDETCPLINNVQATISEARGIAVGAKRPLAVRTKSRRLLGTAENKLEKIRDANSQLRDLGWHWRQCAEDLLRIAKNAEKKLAAKQKKRSRRRTGRYK